MRVHRLEVTAFGPFADTQLVDFEPLNAAGVFLLTGETGAGKTSILDAICFGLFGQVPGVRDRAKAYRSHHAPPGVPPRVVLEVTLQGRRFRLTRHATWARPSARARSGFVEEKARASAEELVGGTWVARSSRADEVGHLVSRLLGLNREQFCQVVMLPQGEFQTFLRAGGRERQHILESLFATQRFHAVERWLVEHRRLQARRCREHEELLARLVARLQEVSPTALAADVDVALLPAVVRSRVEVDRLTLVRAATAAADAATLDKIARHELDEARTLLERQHRHQAARQSHSMLVATREVVVARELSVRRARAAATVLPLVALAADAEQAYVESVDACTRAATRCADIPGLPPEPPASVGELEVVLGRLGDRVSALRALVAVEAQGDRLRDEIERERVSHDRAATTIRDLDVQIEGDPGLVAILRAELAEAARVVQQGEGAEDRVKAAGRALAAAADVRGHDDSLSRLQASRIQAREISARAAECWLDARERYLAGLAAELAGTLREQQACPVCGSTAHPAPALPADEHVTRRDEADLLAAATRAREAVSEIDDAIVAVERARGAALARSTGLDVSQAMAAAAAAREAKVSVAAAAAEHAALSTELQRQVEAADRRRAERERRVAHQVRLTERLGALEGRLAEQVARLVHEVGADGRVDDALAQVTERLVACRDLLTAVRAREERERSLSSARTRLATSLEPSEFTDSAEVLAAAMSPSDIANAEALTRSHAAELGAVTRVLADPALVAAAAEAAPDLEGLQGQAELAAQRAARAAAVVTDLQRRHARLEELLVELEAGVGRLGPLREARDLADDVAGLCTGSSPDNPTRTALSHYVLAARLAQVVAAANLRLDAVCGGRYQLEHTMTGAAGDNRGGLGLLVSDTHTDRRRDPATLSGGETFYVSLSLALGLADVVTHEAGGAELSTLFVDEGFGALDQVTRDEVLDELDALRSGGRTIGLVSHLSELRARFPVQLRIVANRNGSRCVSTSNEEAADRRDEH